MSPTYSFYELKLSQGLREMTEAAKDRAQYALYYANSELRKLSYSDVAYDPLDKVFDQAAIEWHKGQYYRSVVLSGRLQGHESVYKWGKAIRAFTRCQALAKKVYNAPPTKPEDRGLRPWGYWQG